MAPPSKLTKAASDRICSYLAAGAYPETAAAAAGIAKSTFYDWLKRGNADKDAHVESDHASFVDAADAALAKWELRDWNLIGEAAEQIWQAAAWRLERRLPDRYGKRQVEVTGKDSGPVEVKLTFDPNP